MIDKCYEEAKKVIRVCSTKNGLFASGGTEGYNAVWARDSMISLIGASASRGFKDVFKKSIITLAKHQSESGQIPNAVDKWSARKPHVDFASIDSTLWFIMGEYIYQDRYKDRSLFKKHKSKIQKALQWLRCQDVGENGMLSQLPTTDWQDAFPHKYGCTINTQALYFKILGLINDKKSMKSLRSFSCKEPDKCLWNGKFFLAWRWKNHGKYKEQGEWFDALGNLLAVIFNLAYAGQAKSILSYIEKNKADRPYPVMAIHPPIKKGSKGWQDYFEDCDAREPYHYLNGGVWPYIGAFYVLALIKLGRLKKAEKALKKVAESNLKGNFPEWIDPVTKEAYGRLQAWDAGVYILAYESLKRKKVLL